MSRHRSRAARNRKSAPPPRDEGAAVAPASEVVAVVATGVRIAAPAPADELAEIEAGWDELLA
jgi:hypothetical protein